jgi:hypothetical protein
MEWLELLRVVGDDPVFESALLQAGDVEPRDLARSLSRWTHAGKLYQLRRGLYALAPPYQKVKPHPFVIANRMVRGSYVSCESALAHYGLIPDVVPVSVSVCAGRPARWQTPLGDFLFRHIKLRHLRGYRMNDLGGGQRALVAVPEKALLDLVHLTPGADAPAYLRELRLQNLEGLDLAELRRLSGLLGSPKLKRAAEVVAGLARVEGEEYETL